MSNVLFRLIPHFIKRPINNALYELKKYRKVEFNESTKILSPATTIRACSQLLQAKERGAYIRFGDGDIYLISNKRHRHQKPDQNLEREIKEALSLTGKGILKSLALNSNKFGKEPGMEKGVHERTDSKVDKLLRECFLYFIGNLLYSPVALHYLIVFDPDFAVSFLRELRSYNPIFVGGEHNSLNVIHSLFGETDFIKTPIRDAYDQVGDIEQQLITSLESRNREYDVIVFSAGPVTKVLIKRLLLTYKKPVFLFDLGSVIEVFHGRTKWTWAKVSGKTKEDWDTMLSRIASEN